MSRSPASTSSPAPTAVIAEDEPLLATGIAAVKLLEAAGFEVVIEERRACCGRPMLSKGLIEAARKNFSIEDQLMKDADKEEKANIICGNIQTANATVYVIDTVMMPQM